MAGFRLVLSDTCVWPESILFGRAGFIIICSQSPRWRRPARASQGLFVGTGVIEAGCKTLIGGRLKRSGMFWTVRGANAVIVLRCCRHSREFSDYWEDGRG